MGGDAAAPAQAEAAASARARRCLAGCARPARDQRKRRTAAQVKRQGHGDFPRPSPGCSDGPCLCAEVTVARQAQNPAGVVTAFNVRGCRDPAGLATSRRALPLVTLIMTSGLTPPTFLWSH
ncbi:hypothetical protein MC885_005723 [Smutsia gigantea]|nr:hypothetical protein MC885_005723 [Smutsia gigantea]